MTRGETLGMDALYAVKRIFDRYDGVAYVQLDWEDFVQVRNAVTDALHQLQQEGGFGDGVPNRDTEKERAHVSGMMMNDGTRSHETDERFNTDFMHGFVWGIEARLAALELRVAAMELQ